MPRLLASVLNAIAVFAAWFYFKACTPPMLARNSIVEPTSVDINGDRQLPPIHGLPAYG